MCRENEHTHTHTPLNDKEQNGTAVPVAGELLLVRWPSVAAAHHVEVSQGTDGRPVHRARVDSLDPHVVGQQHAEDGDACVWTRQWRYIQFNVSRNSPYSC